MVDPYKCRCFTGTALASGNAFTVCLIEAETKGQQIVLDIKDLTLVGQSDIDFLARCEAAGVKLMNCARYVRDWIARQQGGK